MNIQLIRHATIKLQFNGQTILVDPMFSLKSTLAPVANAANECKNPLVDLPITVEELLSEINAIIITHSHRDHLDDRAIELLPKDLPVFCQREDEEKLISLGFKDVRTVWYETEWKGIRLIRTGGEHGTGELGKLMGPVSGFVLQAEDEPVVYVAGDTIWCSEVEEAIANYSPGVIVLNGGEAQYLTGDPITMGVKDIEKVHRASPSSNIVVVHMESWNHCLLTRRDLRQYIETNQLLDISVPDDGRILNF
ncbi:L-ascorbate metabolism protein UlaG (beta-lactamase superfamily) [Bacillus sp. SLBN-46]|nr:L-ascorbate metabolism protein UlaG (beta-lactamase superfamily) [Bacillus sp. SLBN-46]